jgi:predicted RNA-binding Zn-ribbon protein involved in translation (DUF1610 family)
MKLPIGLTMEDVVDAVERSNIGMENIGFCLACGAEADGVEPDAREYECEDCGEDKVYGAEEILIMICV